MHKILLLSLFLIAKQCSTAQNGNSPILLKEWHSYLVPADKTTIDQYADVDTSWSVRTIHGDLYAFNTFHPSDRERLFGDSLPTEVVSNLWKNEKTNIYRSRRILSVNDGFLIGINKGEFGGYLLWYSKGGSRNYQISEDEVVQIIKRDRNIYAIQGLDHLNSSKGSIIEIIKKDTSWTAKEYLKLPAAPEGIDIDSKGNFIIATSDQLIRIDKERKVETLIKTPIWRRYKYLYPESVFIQDDIVYIGMRKGIFKYDLNTKKEEWLMKD